MGKALYTTQATAHGGRVGRIETQDQQLNVKLSVPRELGGEGGDGTNPEQLFAAGYASCFQSAMGSVARREKIQFDNSEVTAMVGLLREEGAYSLEVEIQVKLPGLTREQAEDLVRKAHEVCPYSRATSGNIDVKLTVLDS